MRILWSGHKTSRKQNFWNVDPCAARERGPSPTAVGNRLQEAWRRWLSICFARLARDLCDYNTYYKCNNGRPARWALAFLVACHCCLHNLLYSTILSLWQIKYVCNHISSLLVRFNVRQLFHARLIFDLRRSDQVSDALISLHWLRIPQRIQFISGRPHGKVLHGCAPSSAWPTYLVIEISAPPPPAASSSHSSTVPPLATELFSRLVPVAVAVSLTSWGTTAATRVPRLRIREWTRG